MLEALVRAVAWRPGLGTFGAEAPVIMRTMTPSDPASPTSAPTTRDPAVDDALVAAFVLGWRLAELYDRDSLPPPPAAGTTRSAPAHLPGASEATDYDRAVVLIDQVRTAVRSLSGVFGGQAPNLDDVRATLDREDHEREDVQLAVLEVHNDIRTRLTAVEPRLGTAYGLGRLLADTVWLPRSGRKELYRERFEHFRLANAHAWLDDLDRAFPSGAAGAVRAGLRAWEARVAALLETDETGGVFDERVLRALRQQGEIWRRLLANEKDPSSLLSSNDYVAAANGLLRRGRAIGWHFLRAWWLVILLVLLVAAGAIWAAVSYAPTGTDRVVAVLVSIGGALGVSWKGVSASLGQTLRRAEAALWAAEVEEAVGRAATVLPDPSSRR